MLKKSIVGLFVLLFAMSLVTPPKANAAVVIGVGPAYVGIGHNYARPYGYVAPAPYVAPVPAPYVAYAPGYVYPPYVYPQIVVGRGYGYGYYGHRGYRR